MFSCLRPKPKQEEKQLRTIPTNQVRPDNEQPPKTAKDGYKCYYCRKSYAMANLTDATSMKEYVKPIVHQMSSEKQIPVLLCSSCLNKQKNKFIDEATAATNVTAKDDSEGGDANSQSSNRVSKSLGKSMEDIFRERKFQRFHFLGAAKSTYVY